MIHRGRLGSNVLLTNFHYLLSRQTQPFQKTLVSFRVFPLEQSVPVLHRCFIQADSPEPFDPLVDRYLVFHLLLLSSRIFCVMAVTITRLKCEAVDGSRKNCTASG